MKLFTLIINILVGASTLGCVRAAQSSMAGMDPGLVLKGTVLNLAGTPQQDVLVYFEQGQHSAATTDASGIFTISFKSEDLDVIKNKTPYERSVFYLYLEWNQAGLYTAVSDAIEATERGHVTLEKIQLYPAVSVQGTVQDLSVEGAVENCGDANIRLGRVTTKSAADGSFALQNITAGTVPIIVSKNGLETYAGEIDTAATDFAARMQQIVLFTQDVQVGGALLTVEASLSDAQGLSPLTRLFNAHVTRQTRYVRLSTDQAALTNAGINNALIPWQRVDQTISYQFNGVGGHILYYQFTDIAQTMLTAISQTLVNVDAFANCQGVQINDGALTAADPNVTLNIDVPSSATQMRMAENSADLAAAPWTNPATTLVWQFAPLGSNDGQSETRSIYVQFADALHNLSNVYQAQIALTLFTDINSKTVVVGDGSGTTKEASVLITVSAPALTSEMRMAEDSQQLLQMSWQQIQPSFSFLLSGVTSASTLMFDCTVLPTTSYQVTPGTHKLYYQFRDNVGYLSDIQSTSVDVEVAPCVPPVITALLGPT